MTHSLVADIPFSDAGWRFTHPNGTKLFGPAGAGKTRALVDWIGEHEADGDFRATEGIICSFTKAAAHDIARRVNPERSPGQYHTTLHAVAKRYLGIDSPLAEMHHEDFFRGEGIGYQRTARPNDEAWVESGGEPGNLLIGFWNRCRNRMVSFEQGLSEELPRPAVALYWSAKVMNRLYERYCAWKRENDLIDFTDMLEIALESPPSNGWWPLFVMDECQDSTRLQWAVAWEFARRAEVCYLGGDDDQAIYSFAGATPNEFLDADCGEPVILPVNHRSGSAIVARAQSFIRRNKRRVDKEMVAAREGGEVTTLGELPELDVGRSAFVMARAHYLMDDWISTLEERYFPFVDRRKKYGVNGGVALAYHRFLNLSRGERVRLEDWRLLVNDGIPSKGPWLMYGAKKRLRELDKQYREQTLISLRDIGDYGATEELMGAIKTGDIACLGHLPQNRLGYLRGVERKHGAEFLEEGRAAQVCQVGPIHQFKGLEADDVVLHSGFSPAAAADAAIDPESERRVIYVAMTRPRDRLLVVDAPSRMPRWADLL